MLHLALPAGAGSFQKPWCGCVVCAPTGTQAGRALWPAAERGSTHRWQCYRAPRYWAFRGPTSQLLECNGLGEECSARDDRVSMRTPNGLTMKSKKAASAHHVQLIVTQSGSIHQHISSNLSSHRTQRQAHVERSEATDGSTRQQAAGELDGLGVCICP